MIGTSTQAAAYAAYSAIIDGEWDDYLPQLAIAIRKRAIELGRKKVTIP